jgi:uncharacterized Zn ribbon protein
MARLYELRRCDHCHRRYWWMPGRGVLCPRCDGLLKAGLEQNDQTEENNTSKTSADAPSDVEETSEGQFYLPGCGPLHLE